MIKAWSDDAWNDYLYWHDQGNKNNIKKINKLIKDIDRSPFSGLGKPEPLKHDLSGKWSRRITDEHRLIYKVENETIYFYSAKDHY
ncbi:Plasmid encoded toxin, Txe/YoeB family [Enterococcus casseliflavus]|uniref:Txe/YoeB family addiction module toxin n=1 Tax=Enterococcus TaxID=1350 RepID=UPI00035347D9|nr:Txe/YoeB family addiction module toxin [Enterococcus casseliflavus]EPH92632.1 addiction module toxin, Txe/YoeB family [Enterococcus faecalis 06-MB-DW-09]GEB29999.1 Txe/YoeB family addiction module toxin [Enterococcus casseliflavus]STP33354.1 Plasmid encoded toxin, Txe/YoeB family [Enterococcus casseliflavus]